MQVLLQKKDVFFRIPIFGDRILLHPFFFSCHNFLFECLTDTLRYIFNYIDKKKNYILYYFLDSF